MQPVMKRRNLIRRRTGNKEAIGVVGQLIFMDNSRRKGEFYGWDTYQLSLYLSNEFNRRQPCERKNESEMRSHDVEPTLIVLTAKVLNII